VPAAVHVNLVRILESIRTASQLAIRAAVLIHVISIFTFFPGHWIDESIPAPGDGAVRVAGCGVAASITLFARIHDPVTAVWSLACLGAPLNQGWIAMLPGLRIDEAVATFGWCAIGITVSGVSSVVTLLASYLVNDSIATRLGPPAGGIAAVARHQVAIITHFAGMTVQCAIATGAGDASVLLGGTEHPWGAEDPARTYRGIRDVHATTCCQEKRQRE
jgi:hypothetical protein